MLCSVNLKPGAGGGVNYGGQNIDCFVGANTDNTGLSSLVVAELGEIFMGKQNKGWVLNWSNGEALSKVLATVLYPQIANRWSNGNDWLNNARPDWINHVEHTDQNGVSTGCGTLFLNYLAHELSYSWQQIIVAGALPGQTLADTANHLGLANAFSGFKALLDKHFPPGQPTALPDDNPFPLEAHPGKIKIRLPVWWHRVFPPELWGPYGPWGRIRNVFSLILRFFGGR